MLDVLILSNHNNGTTSITYAKNNNIKTTIMEGIVDTMYPESRRVLYFHLLSP